MKLNSLINLQIRNQGRQLRDSSTQMALLNLLLSIHNFQIMEKFQLIKKLDQKIGKCEE
ncbi:unnamed protein product [Paramecium octaurelia]|uniref:Uncharacterized protein n=1 Tax=Paramecium octaurelia TaxID=43137 RepID=A0A8S1UD30_PAROT|nr:unnamed protein product [Paramecium octaurelia]